MKSHVQYVHVAELPWREAGGGWRRKVVNRDEAGPAAIELIELTAGWTGVLHDGDVAEVYVVAGNLHFDDGVVGGPGSYHRLSYALAAAQLRSPDGAVLVVQTGGEWQRPREAIHLASDEFAWAPHGQGVNRSEMAVLHDDAITGAQTYALRLPAGWVGRAGQHFHTVSEEVFILDGDVALEESPTYVGGTYIFRPPYVVHGQRERSVGGCLALTWTNGPLDFNYVAVEGPLDVPHRPDSSFPRAASGITNGG